MPVLDRAVLDAPARLHAVSQARETFAGMPVGFDAIARMTARLTNAPIGMISLLGSAEEELIGRYGVPEWFAPDRHGARHALCAYVVCGNEVLAVEELPAGEGASDDPLRSNPLLADGGIRAFAGAPLRDEAGRPLGAVSVADTVARAWHPGELAVLAEVAEMLRFEPDGEAARATLGEEPPPSGRTGRAWPSSMQAGFEGDRRFFAALLDSLQVGVVVADSTGRPVLVNKMARERNRVPAGLSPEEAIATICRRLRHSDGTSFERHEMVFVRALVDENVQRAESILQGTGFRDHHVVAYGKALRTDEGELFGSVTTVLDVTDRWRADRFRDCNLRIATMLNHADTVEEAGPELVDALGEALDWPCVALWLANPAEHVLDLVAHHLDSGIALAAPIPDRVERGGSVTGECWQSGTLLWVPRYAESRYARGPGAQEFSPAGDGPRPYTAVAVPIRDEACVVGVLTCFADTVEHDRPLLTGLLEDIAEQVGYFLARHHSMELAMQLVRTRDDFIALVGHELRTPLTSITTCSDLLLEDEQLSDDARELVEIVSRNVGSVHAIIEDLLDLAALESGHLRPQLLPVDLVAVVSAAIAELGDQAGTRLHTGLPSTVVLAGDARRLRQVVDNLLSNAVKYSPDGGDIHVELVAGEDFAELAVTDNGIGIPPEDRDRLFDRFYRGGNARHNIPGTGLGLTLVRTIVQAHCGTVALDPTRKNGTRILVRLPLHAAATTPADGQPGVALRYPLRGAFRPLEPIRRVPDQDCG
ncbi:sensor histidine kinase [Actinoplanes flavus]|uniref:histidine kinase n=1 Tax=Actinoplanes flavus TaxID=2820290 RepID=A0ABS3UKP4_9ACTN|nr:ATP-binding protein [Actinoplanes flavus]MBO3739357.1 GAF domain-containing protein [Actinoplanes flavus]